MKTFWTLPNEGATLAELLELATIHDPFEKSQEKLSELVHRYGKEARGGLGINFHDDLFEELDADRICGDIFKSHLASNRTIGDIANTGLKTKEELEAALAEYKADERCYYKAASVFSNAPLALIQTSLEARVNTLEWALGLPLSEFPLKKVN